MFFSHRFGSVETLSRARYWLTRHGFEVASTDPESHDASRLSIRVDFSQAAAAMALIDSIEHSDPEGWPGYLTPTRSFPGREARTSDHQAHEPARSPIHWHRRDDSTSADPESHKVCEYMFSRWE